MTAVPKVDLSALAMTLTLGALGGIVAQALRLPLGYLLGSLVITGVIAAAGWRPLGRPITLPARLRMAFVPVIGVAIGGAFTPAVAGQALGWWPSLLALCLYVPLAHALGFGIYRRGGLSPKDAFFGAVPGGLIESVQLGEEAGADVRLLTVLQFLRLIGTIIAVPLIFWAITGRAVGSASGVAMVGAGAPLSTADVAILIASGIAGVLVGRKLRLPGWIITGPLAASAVAHALGWVEGVPPGWLIAATQVVLGTGLGARFAGVERAMLRRAAGLALVNGVVALALAYGFANAVHAVADEPVTAAFLAFAPGGLAEMSLIALSLQMSAIYVTAHHVVRIILAVGLAKLGARWVR
ncbi:MAG: AbrB family transcriptional regulator [Pseudomonadota bacterium]